MVRDTLLYAVAAFVALVIPFPLRRAGRSSLPPAFPVETFEVTFCDLKPIPGKIVDSVAETLSIDDPIDDACMGCEAKSGSDCNRCAYFLASIDKIKLETVSRPPIEPEIPRSYLRLRDALVRPMTNKRLAKKLHIGASATSILVSKAVALGYCQRTSFGNCVAIEWIGQRFDVSSQTSSSPNIKSNEKTVNGRLLIENKRSVIDQTPIQAIPVSIVDRIPTLRAA